MDTADRYATDGDSPQTAQGGAGHRLEDTLLVALKTTSLVRSVRVMTDPNRRSCPRSSCTSCHNGC
jgi:hypothetical protein